MPSATSQPPSSLLQQAIQHHRAGRLDQAAALYQRALGEDPDDVSVLVTLGGLWLQQGRIDQARAPLARAVHLQPDDAGAWMALGTALARGGELDDAERAFRRVAALRPQSAAAPMNLGNVQRRQGRLAEAIASYRAALALEPRSAQAQFNLGNALADSDALDEAVRAFEAALAVDPGFLAARNNLGSALLRLGRADAALRCFEAVVAADPGFPRGLYSIGAALQALGRDRPAIAAYRRALAQDPRDPASLNNLCVALLRAGDADAALAVCERALQLSPGDRTPLAYKAAALIELGRREQASALLDFDRLILPRIVDPVPGFASMAAFNQALSAQIRAHPSLRFEPPDKSTCKGSQTGELMVQPTGALEAMTAIVRDAVAAYMAHLRSVLPDHPYTAHLPSRWRLSGWAVVLQSQGHQGPHFHPAGYISGVYYVALPNTMADPDEAGCIEFGRTTEAVGGSQTPLTRLVHPREGLMLLFPSYFYHRTVPFQSDEPRISVAFDVVPES